MHRGIHFEINEEMFHIKTDVQLSQALAFLETMPAKNVLKALPRLHVDLDLLMYDHDSMALMQRFLLLRVWCDDTVFEYMTPPNPSRDNMDDGYVNSSFALQQRMRKRDVDRLTPLSMLHRDAFEDISKVAAHTKQQQQQQHQIVKYPPMIPCHRHQYRDVCCPAKTVGGVCTQSPPIKPLPFLDTGDCPNWRAMLKYKFLTFSLGKHHDCQVSSSVGGVTSPVSILVDDVLGLIAQAMITGVAEDVDNLCK